MIEMKCPHCGHQLRMANKYAGRPGGCKHCGGKFVVSEAAAPPASPEKLNSTSRPGPHQMDSMPSSSTSPPAEFVDVTSLESLNVDAAFEPSGESAKGAAVSKHNPKQSFGQFDSLGCLFWGLAFFVPPVAIVWAVFIPREHPNKRSALAVPIGFTIAMIVLFAGMLSLSEDIRAVMLWSTLEESIIADGQDRSIAMIADEQEQLVSTATDERTTVDIPGLIIIAYDAGPYDMTAISLYVEATLEVFPIRNYPSIEQLADAYKTVRQSPTRENGKALEQALSDFSENLSDADEEKGLEVLDKVMDAGMKQSTNMTAEERSIAAVQLMITAWVSSIEQSHQYLGGEVGDVVSASAFDQLKGEMSYDEVSAIIGREGECPMRSSSTVDGERTTSAQCAWSWELETGGIASIHACFLNDELRVKAYGEVPH